MKYLPIPSDLFILNRKNFTGHLKPRSLAVFNSNDIMPTNADGVMPFRQNNDLFYLSGIDQEETILLIYPDCNNKKHKEILFVKETNEKIAVWEGQKLTQKKAAQQSGISTVYWLKDFDVIFDSLVHECENIYLNSNEHSRAEKVVETREDRFNKWCQEKYPLHKYERSSPVMHLLRAIKSPIEIDLMKTAAGITGKAFRRVLGFIKPDVYEFEIEAEIQHEFLRNRSSGPAYQSIIASGANACILHYINNDRQCKDGEMILMDFGAEYANYASDLTRTVPVNGRFTPRQRDVYTTVLHIMKEAIKILVPGNTLDNYHKETGRLMESGLIDLGLLDKHEVSRQDPSAPLYKKYFMHGTSHFLGLDVHDVGDRNRPFEAGMVFTCEPGIYIREENLGIRLENDILITEKGPIDLMADIPIEPEDIETLMKK